MRICGEQDSKAWSIKEADSNENDNALRQNGRKEAYAQ